MSSNLSTFAGLPGEDVTSFLQNIQKDAFTQERQRDDIWVADYALTWLGGEALAWYYDLDEETQGSWRKLRVALLSRFRTTRADGTQVPVLAALGDSDPADSPPEYSPQDPRCISGDTSSSAGRDGGHISIGLIGPTPWPAAAASADAPPGVAGSTAFRPSQTRSLSHRAAIVVGRGPINRTKQY